MPRWELRIGAVLRTVCARVLGQRDRSRCSFGRAAIPRAPGAVSSGRFLRADAPERTPPMMAERHSRPRTRGTSQRHSVPLDILVVDDDQATRLSLSYALTDAGHKVTEACDGEEAIAVVAERI